MYGEQLVEKGIVTREQLWEALRLQSRTGKFLGNILIELGLATEDSIVNIPGLQQIKLDDIDPVLLRTIPEQLVRRHMAIPIKKENKCLTVAMADPMNVMAIDDLRLLTGCEIEPVQADKKDILTVIQKNFGILDVGKFFEDYELLADQQEPENTALEAEVNEAPIVRLVNSIFLQAIEQNASDIHIEPQEDHARIRYRIDGMLREIMTIPQKIQSALISRVKIMSDMDIAEKRVPQDGRFQLKFGSREIDLRVSTMPTVYGEKIVARLLDKGNMKSFKIEQIGLGPENLTRFMSTLRRPYGMLLITGPTGSGKTTTLYAALNEINKVERNIITVEDPVEYMLRGINQTQVNTKSGMTFAVSLRAILRQDPDIIMVGEIRDSETAEIATRAAMTGHMVLSTIHTNNAAGAIIRLVDMGIEPFLVASSVLAATAQRLVRLICPKCRRAYVLGPDATEREFIGVRPERPVTLYRGVGCDECDNVGYRGRLAIHEVMPMTAALRALVIKNASANEIELKALAEEMISLKTDGIRKALSGLTTIEEVMRVTYTDEA